MRVYSMRMEILFYRLDGNQNGRLELRELQGLRVLERRLKRQDNRSYLLLNDLRSRGCAAQRSMPATSFSTGRSES